MDPISYAVALGAAGSAEQDDYWVLAIETTLSDYYNVASGHGVFVDSARNVYFSGTPRYTNLKTQGQGENFPTVFKIDKSGAIQWVRQLYNNSTINEDHYVTRAVADSSGNVYLPGTRNNYFTNIAKFNSSGTEQFIKAHNANGNNTDYITDTAIDSSGNIYLAGQTQETYLEGSIKKISSSGTVTWERKFTANSYTVEFSGVDVDSSGNVYVVGYGRPGTTSSAILVVKLSSTGSTTWQKSVQLGSDSYSNLGYGICVDSSGNVYVVGRSSSNGSMLVKFNSSGTMQWARELAIGNETMVEVRVDSDDNVYTAGQSDDNNSMLIWCKFNTSGTLQLARKFTTTNGFSLMRRNSSIFDIDDKNNLYLITFDGNNAMPYVIKVPNDGSLTGDITFASNVVNADLVYASASFTVSSVTPSVTTPSSTDMVNSDINSSTITSDFSSGTYTSYDSDLDTIS